MLKSRPDFDKMSSITRCCDTGRPIVVDAGTGRTVCSCQLQKGLPSYLSRVPTLPETVYGTGSSVYSQANMLSAMYRMYGQDNPADNVTLTTGVTHPVMPMNAHAIAAHPYAFGYPGFDIHGARRKNATRETTSPLKAWLYTHKKNPYPTKAEKIMLAIVTRMTLTQVSTWFANARRRLKKENRLNGNDDDSLSDISGKDDRIDIDTSTEQLFHDDDDVVSKTGNVSDISETSDSLEQNAQKDRLGKKCVQKLFSPDGRNELYLERIASPDLPEGLEHSNTDQVYIDVQAPLADEKELLEQTRSTTVEAQQNIFRLKMLDGMPEKQELSLPKRKAAAPPQQKPKIWSIAQIIA